jgi:hypothetical protein
MDRWDRLFGLEVVNTSMDGKGETKYKRLPGRGSRRGGFVAFSFSKCSLYLGDDHVLAVDSTGFSEDYKRFYFSDIQAIITRRTRHWTTWSIILALMIICSSMGALFLKVEALRIFFWSLSGTLLVFLLFNIFRGPTCICHMMTAVQQNQLPSLNRLRVAHKVIEMLRPDIERAQGRHIPEEVNIDQDERISHPMRPLRQPRARGREIRHDDGTLHMMTFALILLDGILTGINLLHHTIVMATVSSLLTAGYCVCIVAALVKQRDSDIPGTIRTITWASLGFVCVSYFLSYILMVTSMVTIKPEKMATQWDMYWAMLDLSPQESLVAIGVYAFVAACSLALGTVGLFRVKRHRENSANASRADRNSRGKATI